MEQKKSPTIISLEPGTHYLCSCGNSKNMPKCDGSHVGTEFTPHVEIVTEAKKIALCACGKSDSMYCNGNHKNITE